jgi:hypothetical protein
MSHANRNFVIAYIFLVGLPLLCLAAVLKSGRGLSAPYSVDGAWKIEASADRASPSPCDNFFSAVSNVPLSISQSGDTLVVALNGGAKTTTGTLAGKTITAQFTGAGEAAECIDRNLTLTATLDPQANPRTLSGTLSVDNCGACLLPFRAVRQARNAGRGSH